MPATGDTISVECACGKRLKAPATAIGRRAKCPACANVLTIEAPPPPPEIADDDPLGAMYDLAETEKAAANSSHLDDSPRCPKCAAAMSSGAVLCTNCGFDSRSNKKITAAAAPKPSTVDYATAGKKKPVDKMAPDGSFMVGLLVSLGMGAVGGAFWFLITWATGINIYIVCAIVGACAGVGMRIGYQGYSYLGGWGAVGVTLVIQLVVRYAIVMDVFVPAFERISHHSHVGIGDPAFMIMYFSMKGIVMMALTMWLAWRTASGVVWG
jgi:hypothetical protein